MAVSYPMMDGCRMCPPSTRCSQRVREGTTRPYGNRDGNDGNHQRSEAIVNSHLLSQNLTPARHPLHVKNGRSQRLNRRDCLAAFWPPGDAQHCRLLRTNEQYFSRSAPEWAGSGCA